MQFACGLVRLRRCAVAVLASRRANGARRSLGRRVVRWLSALAVACLLLSAAAVLLLRFVDPVTTMFMLERRIEAIRTGDHNFRLQYRFTPLAQISAELPIALVAAEDQKFPNHHGFDVAAIHAALDEADEGERQRGASTITQQTAKNLFLWGGHSFVRKGLEAYFTVLLELMWSKARIIEVYANVAEFGDGIYGVDAAAHAFFGKPASALTAHEAALLAATLPNPKKLSADHPSAYLLQRAAWIEQQVRQLGGAAYLTH